MAQLSLGAAALFVLLLVMPTLSRDGRGCPSYAAPTGCDAGALDPVGWTLTGKAAVIGYRFEVQLGWLNCAQFASYSPPY
jgi:hypothetical protein